MTSAEDTYRFYNQSSGYLKRLEGVGWRPEYGAVLGALHRHGLKPGERILDFGCGVGDLVATMARASYRAVGADISLVFVQSALARYPGLAFVALGPGPALPFPSRQFAAVTAINTIEHVVRPAAALQELARLLQPGGLLALTFPNLLSPLRPLKRFLVRHHQAKYGPESGESAGEALRLLVRNLALMASISLSQRPRFLARQADFANAERYRLLGYGADYDAVWLSNPSDVKWHLRNLGLQVLELTGMAGAAERSRAVNRVRQILPAPLSSPILLVARRPWGERD